MEAEKRKNATINKKDMEAEAATKIQAGFRGYQVRKQLKQKVSARQCVSIVFFYNLNGAAILRDIFV